MRKCLFFCALAILLSSIHTFAQQPQTQPLTFWYDYTVNFGKEDQFLELVKTVGAPVREKMLADGVIRAWGVMTPLLRQPGNATHTIWYTVDDYAGVEKVEDAMRAQIAKLTEEAGKSGVAKKGSAAPMGLNARLAEAVDVSKTRDFLTRDIVFGLGPSAPPLASSPIPDLISLK